MKAQPPALEPGAKPAAAALHLGFSDPRSPLRVGLPLPVALRVALQAQLAARGGAVVESAQGFSAFHSQPLLAVQAAVEVLAVSAALAVDEAAPIALRAVIVGLADTDDATRAAALTRAVRLTALSRDHTLLLTRDLYEGLDPVLADRARLAVAPSLVDSHPELANLFDLDWKSAALRLPEVTGIPEPHEASSPSDRLELSHGGKVFLLAAADCPFTLGRDKSCSLQLDGDVASRVHGRIEFAHEKFYYVDDSRNGTYLLTPQGEEVFTHRERLPLLGRGVISPGAPIVKQTGEVVRYACREADPVAELVRSMVPAPGPAPEPLVGTLAAADAP
jgi:hypothetical protein